MLVDLLWHCILNNWLEEQRDMMIAREGIQGIQEEDTDGDWTKQAVKFQFYCATLWTHWSLLILTKRKVSIWISHLRNITCKRRKGWGAKREKQERWDGIIVRLLTEREKKEVAMEKVKAGKKGYFKEKDDVTEEEYKRVCVCIMCVM